VKVTGGVAGTLNESDSQFSVTRKHKVDLSYSPSSRLVGHEKASFRKRVQSVKTGKAKTPKEDVRRACWNGVT